MASDSRPRPASRKTTAQEPSPAVWPAIPTAKPVSARASSPISPATASSAANNLRLCKGLTACWSRASSCSTRFRTFRASRTSALSFTGGYANSEDVSTYVASRLEGAFRGTESFNRPGLVSLKSQHLHLRARLSPRESRGQHPAGLLPARSAELATATRVGGPASPGFATPATSPWTRTAAPTPAFRNSSLTRPSAPRPEFNRIDTTNSSYYASTKASSSRANTRYGQMRAFGSGSSG